MQHKTRSLSELKGIRYPLNLYDKPHFLNIFRFLVNEDSAGVKKFSPCNLICVKQTYYVRNSLRSFRGGGFAFSCKKLGKLLRDAPAPVVPMVMISEV